MTMSKKLYQPTTKPNKHINEFENNRNYPTFKQINKQTTQLFTLTMPHPQPNNLAIYLPCPQHLSSPPLPSPLDISTYSITPSQLQSLYEQHWLMKQQIDLLKTSLIQCETKWNKVVNSIVKENVELKSSEDYYKKKYHNLVERINQKRQRKSQECIRSENNKAKGNNSKIDLLKENDNKFSLESIRSDNQEDL